MPTILPHPYPSPSARVAALMEVLVKEHDGACSIMAQLESELMTE